VIVVAAAGTDLAVRSGIAVLAGALLVVTVAAGMLATGRLENPQARAMVATAPLFGVWLSLRSSPWLVPLDVVASGGLLCLGASFARGGSVLDLSLPQAVVRVVAGLAHGVATPAFALGPVRSAGRRVAVRAGGSGKGRAVARGILLAVPLLVVLGVLLASADAVFAAFFRVDVNVDVAGSVPHVAALVLGAWGAGGLLRVASGAPVGRLQPMARRIGRLEATIVLGSLVGLFAAFAAAQLVVLAGGGRHVIQTAGLTYAQYARSGFFQLLAVAVITLAVLLSLRAVADLEEPRARRSLLALSEATVGLSLVIVFVAVRRMDIYERAFGLTMLRLYVRLFSLWIGGAFALLAVALAGAGRRRAWLPSAAAAMGLAFLLALNVVNPEAVVVRHNVAFAQRAHRFDLAYLSELSDDAVPALVGVLPELGANARAEVVARLCPREQVPWTGWAAYNLSRRRADRALAELCSGPAGAAVPSAVADG